ncbi:NAD-dependent epimerase/dehydratase family protein [Streptomyces sulphureus]|uniref:NAD-dependent epimerase/dehydratase family protein n=1 Tax=Streptomyces sulphureus TaxID=47758 RepID=UPI00036960A3|nr:NAD(P)-dependent oxidoreductase [Streptomyces sulphureus]
MTTQRSPGAAAEVRETVLLTGTAGFLGRWTAQALAGRPRVAATARSAPDGPFDIRAGADLTSEREVRQLHAALPSGPVRLIHLAGEHRSPAPERLLQANVAPLLHLLDVLGDRLSHLTLASSVAIYGFPSGTPGPGPRSVDPLTAYGRSKWLQEQAAGLFRAHREVPVAVLRLASLYGEGGSTNAVGALARCAATGGTFTVGAGPHGLSARDYLHAEDAARAVVAASDALHDGALDIGSGTALSPFDLVETARRAGEQVRVAAHASPADVTSSFACDAGPAARVLGFRPRVTLLDGFRRTLAWYRGPGGREVRR